jgi:hypothetical protein
MTLVGFSFTKINAERKPASEQNINVESNATVTSITELNSIDPKKTLLKFDFEFTCKYEPGVGKIVLTGEVVEIYDKDFASQILEYWKKESKIHADVLQEVFNLVLARSNMEAIIISKDMGLPSPIQMPRIDARPVENKEPKIIPAKDSKVEQKKK